MFVVKGLSLFHGEAFRSLLALVVCLSLGRTALGGEANPVDATFQTPPSAGVGGVGSVVAALAKFNRGAALLDQYRYSDAAAEFEEVLKAHPDWTAARFNLGLAYLNLEGQAGKGARDAKSLLEQAQAAFEAVLRVEPDHLPARFLMGTYFQHIGDDEAALRCYEAVHQRDAKDAHVAYKYAESLSRAGRSEESTKLLETIVERDPGFISAIYRLFQQYQRSGQRDKVGPLVARFKKLHAAELAGGTFVVSDKYGDAGKYYRALGADDLPLPISGGKPDRRIVFSPQVHSVGSEHEPWEWAGGKIDLLGIAVGDLDGDGDLDLCLSGCGDGGATALFVNDGRGQFSAGPTVADGGVSPCLGDVDNDGDLDLWLGRAGGDRLFENDGRGGLTDRTESVSGPDAVTCPARLVDLDSDGDLDLLAFRSARGGVPASGEAAASESSLWNNNRDGSWTDVAESLGLRGNSAATAAVVSDDIDVDRDLDLLVFPAGDDPPWAWVNDRAGAFHVRAGEALGCGAGRVRSATSADPDKDGDQDLLLFAADGLHLYLNAGDGHYAEETDFRQRHGSLGGTSGQFADMDNDGDLDLVIADARRRSGDRGPVLLINRWPSGGFANAGESDGGLLLNAVRVEECASCVVADFTGDGRCDVLLAPRGESPVILENATPGGHWIQLDLRGTVTADQKTRSNNSAIGARVEIKTGGVLQQFVVGGGSGPVAMASHRVHAGLGDNAKVDWLRIYWPDAVLQAELELPADRVTTVAELQRKTSSCPYLFAWNGSYFEFVADFGGVGGLGYWIGPGRYAVPDPTEVVPIPRLEPRDGKYVLQCLTPLEEVTYFDEAKLIAVDHPAGTDVLPYEMMAVGAPPPPFEIFCFDTAIEPRLATDNNGRDVTDALRAVDRRYAGATLQDHRFHGLAADHQIELDFGDRLSAVAAGQRIILVLQGWVEYGYSSTNYAAHQAGLRLRAPSISVLRNGAWTDLFTEVGYPAGVNHVMTLDMTGKLLPTDCRLRISSNMELYWDRIFLAEHRPQDVRGVHEAAADRADLHHLGYPREYSPDGQRPNLSDYGNIDRAVAWKLMEGQFTRYGDVRELLQAADDCYVVMGHGDEVTLEFSAAALPPVPAGCRRTFLLKSDSYCKDMDLHTAHPNTVDPLPFHGMSGYPYGPGECYPQTPKTTDYLQRYNTRSIRSR